MAGAEANRDQPLELGRFSAGLILAILVAIAFLIRWRVGLYQLPSFDGCGYIMHAKSIAAGKLTTIYWAKGVDHYYQPLYPFAIVICHLFLKNWMTAASFANYILGAMLLIPVYFFGARVYGKLGGIFAAALLASYPVLVDLSSNPSSEPAFVLAFAAGLYFFQRLIEEKNAGMAALAGLSFGLSYLARAQAAIFLPISLVTFLWLVLRKKLTLMQGAKYLALVVVGFYIFGLPYDLYCIRKEHSYGLRARQEFFKKVAEPQTNAYYIAERDLDRDAEMLANFRIERQMSPIKYVRTHTREYLAQVGIEFRHSAFVMIYEGMILNILIVSCMFFALLSAILKKPPGIDIRKLEPYGIWIFSFIVIPPFTAPAPVRYYVGLTPIFAVLGAGGILFLRDFCARAKWSAWLKSRPGLLLWLVALLVLYPHARVDYLASKKEMDAKQEYQIKVADWLNKVLPEHGKTIMSSLPYAALATGSNWYLLPLDWPMRTIHYAQVQGADYLLAEEYPFAWVVLPPDWSDYFTTPFSKPGLEFIASYPEGEKFPVAVIYKVEKPKPKPDRLPNIIMIVAESGWQPSKNLAANGVTFDNMIAASTDDPRFNMASILYSLWLEKYFEERSLSGKALLHNIHSLPALIAERGYSSSFFRAPGSETGDFFPTDFAPEIQLQPRESDVHEILDNLGQKSELPKFILIDTRNSTEFNADLMEQFSRQKVLNQNTLLIITAFPRPAGRENQTLSRVDVKIPLLMIWHGHLPEGEVIAGQCRPVDIIPTLFDYIGLPIPVQAEGVSLRPLIDKNSGLDLAAVTEQTIKNHDVSQELLAAGWLYFRGDKLEMLFNLASGPEAKTDLLAAEITSRLSAQKLKELRKKQAMLKTALENFNLFNQKHLKKFTQMQVGNHEGQEGP